MDRIITTLDKSLTIDLARIKAIRLDENKSKHILTVEYNTQIEYSKNPFTNEIERHEVQNVVTATYTWYQQAKSCQREINESWIKYLAEN